MTIMLIFCIFAFKTIISMDITIVSYNGKLKYGEEQMFRGAFLKELGDKASILFHNHTENGLRYSYPLVQYKIADGKPTVVGIGSGGSALMNLPRECELMIGKQTRNFKIDNINIEPYKPEIADAPKMYGIKRYIPLNTANMEEFDSLPALSDRICFLENIINANILAFFKGIDYHCDAEIQTAISSIDRQYDLYYKGVKFYGFDMKFITNVLLPDDIGLGKSSSVGFGTLKRLPIPNRFKAKLK